MNPQKTMKEINEPELLEINGGGDYLAPRPSLPDYQAESARILAALSPAPANPYDAGNGVYRAI